MEYLFEEKNNKKEDESFNLNLHLKDHCDYFFNKETKEEINEIDEENLFDFDKKYNDFNDNFVTESAPKLDLKSYNESDKNYTNSNYIHFKLSFGIEQFKSKYEAQNKLKLLLKKLLNYELIVEEKNGWRNGKQRFRKRKIKIGEQIKVAAIHTKGFDNLWLVNPHIHLLFDKKTARLGKNFIYLKKAIENIIKEENLNIKASFMQKEGLISKSFKRVMNARSWAVRQGKVNIKTIEKFINDVIKYLDKTHNLEFAIKQFIVIINNFDVTNNSKVKEFLDKIENYIIKGIDDFEYGRNTKLAKFIYKDINYFKKYDEYGKSLIDRFYRSVSLKTDYYPHSEYFYNKLIRKTENKSKGFRRRPFTIPCQLD